VALELHKDALGKAIRPKDLEAARLIDTPSNRQFLAQLARNVVDSDFSTLALRSLRIRDKPTYSIASAPHAVVLNQLNQTIRTRTGVKTSDRDTIIRRLSTILSEGVPHRVYKFDIKDFYDSVDSRLLADRILIDNRIPRASLLLLAHYLTELRNRSIQGLPRGVPLSATLAEYALTDFDRRISTLPHVYFYARYVDDIIVVTSRQEDNSSFSRIVRKALPFNLQFNPVKTRLVDIPLPKTRVVGVVGEFDYLGYNIRVHHAERIDGRISRTVDLSIATKKLRRIQTRLCLSAIDYLQSPDIGTLRRRLQLLTGNYNVREYTTGQKRNVGLYCTYRHITQTDCLRKLDSFLRALLLGRKIGLARRLSTSLSLQERRQLLRFSFLIGFQRRLFYNFKAHELAALKECWRDG
jgi:reverse transcriptase-like protein